MTMRSLAAILMLAAAAAAAPLQSARPAAKPARHPDVILITLDTVRADHLGCYGDHEARTPAIDALARDGVVYERALAQVPLTLPSHVAILTGTYPFRNGVQDFSGQPLSASVRTVAQALSENGYATGAVVSSITLDRSWGLARGFDSYDDRFPAAAMTQPDLGLVERRADASVTAALAWLAKRPATRPFFLWLHLYDAHSPYDPPEPFRTQFKERPYDGEIAYEDAQLARLFAWLKERRLYDGALIVLAGDHGESLGEHGEQEHGFFVYNATARVPLIVKAPGVQRTPAGRVAEPVETIGVATAILQLAAPADPIRTQLQGGGLGGGKPAYTETLYPYRSFGWSPLHALEDGRYHYIEAPQPELYDLAADPQEKTNVVAQHADVAQRMHREIEARLLASGEAPAEPGASAADPRMAERLRALGYFAYPSPVSGGSKAEQLADPKTKIEQYNDILHAADAFRAGDAAQGRALLQRVLGTDPKMYVPHFLLGEQALRDHDWQTASGELQKCLELNPHFDQAMTALARARDALGDAAGASLWLDRALQENPRNYRAWYELGFLRGRSDPALGAEAFAKALAIQPDFALARRDLGMLQFQQKDYAGAAENLARAVELGLDDTKTLNFLGICYSRTDRLQQAVATYQKAIALDSEFADPHLNLAYAYTRLKQPAKAKKEYLVACGLDRRFCQYVPR
jgi:arylsulfatase A-like enzyme/Flp pilus assembly protein TadD